MCSPAICRDCNKVTYSGCGMHADQVMAMFAEDERCSCEKKPRRSLVGW